MEAFTPFEYHPTQFIVVNLIYKVGRKDILPHLEEHIKFLDYYYEKGIFIFSGAKSPKNGGIILAATDKASLEQILEEDPFKQNDLAHYELTVFEVSKCSKEFQLVINACKQRMAK